MFHTLDRSTISQSWSSRYFREDVFLVCMIYRSGRKCEDSFVLKIVLQHSLHFRPEWSIAYAAGLEPYGLQNLVHIACV